MECDLTAKGYRDRAITIYQDDQLKISVLNPYDFIIMKLRRGTEQDLEDCLNVALANQLSVEELDRYFENAISNSIKDTAILNFRLIYNHFRQALTEILSQNLSELQILPKAKNLGKACIKYILVGFPPSYYLYLSFFQQQLARLGSCVVVGRHGKTVSPSRKHCQVVSPFHIGNLPV